MSKKNKQCAAVGGVFPDYSGINVDRRVVKKFMEVVIHFDKLMRVISVDVYPDA